jgi:hypothetical protein
VPFNFCVQLFSLPALSILGAKMWHGLTLRSLKAYHRAAGGDRIGLVNKPGGKIDLQPVKYQTAAETDQETPAGWHVKGVDKHFKPATFGNSGPRLGKTPVIPLDSESWRATSTLEARVAEAVDQGETRPLYRVDDAELTATLDARGAAGARADGGQMQVDDITFEPRSSPVFDDTIINLNAGAGYNGAAVSWAKAKELMRERTTTDEMDRQEQRGLLAGMSRNDMKSLMLKLMLIAGAIALGGLVGPELVTAVLGSGGGGGGGGIVPISLNWVGGL